MPSILSHPISLMSILMLSSHPWLSLPSGFFLSTFMILWKCRLVVWVHWDLMIPDLHCLWRRNLSTAGGVKHYYQIFISNPDSSICDYKLKWPEHAQGNHCICELASKSILWRIDPLLGNDQTDSIMHAAMEILLEAVFFMWFSLMLDWPSSVQLVSAMQLSTVEWSELVEQSVRGLLQFSCCEPLLLNTGSWGTGIVQ
jgi:hypothetical protein